MSCKSPLKKAIELIDAGNNIFITGGGGVGKSYLLNQLKKHYGDDLKITSTTGVSAYNIDGQTIHSFAGIYKNKIYLNFPDTKRKLTKNLKECRILAIDEISMLHKETLDSLNSAFKEITGCRNKPFGGIQMIFIGDFFQLPPVPQKTNRYSKSKNAEYCFKSHAWEAGNFITLDLKEVKRQNDKMFISALNKVRTGNITQDVIDLFEERERKFDIKADSKTLCIFSRKEKMNKHNDNMLKTDENCRGEKRIYTAVDYYCETIDNEKQEYPIPVVSKGYIENKEYKIAKAILSRECRFPEEINLRSGCRVMLLKNLDQAKGLVNGSCGVVKSHSDDEVIVKFDKVKEEQVIKKDSFYFQYRYIEDEKTGKVIKNGVKRVQFPLQLAYAITIHKSQGMTFDELVVDLENVFDKGMSYVALSRNRTLENLYIRHFKSKEIKTSQEVIDFYNNLKNCITFTEDGEMIEKFGETIEEENKDTISPSSETIIISKAPKTEDDEYNDPMETNEYSVGYEYSIVQNTEKINSDPNNCICLNYRAEAYYGNKEYENALNDLNKILEIDSEYEIDYFKKAYAEHKTDNNQQAIEDYTEYLKYNPNCAAAYNNRGWAKECYEYSNYNDAIKDYSRAINLDPNNCQYLNNRARAYYWNQEYENAIDDWNKVLEIDPDYKIDFMHKAHAENVMAEIYYEYDEYGKAVDKWSEILKIDPDYEIDYFDKAYAEDEIGQYAEAIDDYTKYLEIEPESDNAYNNRGWCKYNINDYIGAINDYSEAIKLDSECSLYFKNRANAYYKLKEYQNAVNDWNKALEINPDYEIDYFDKAYAENEIGQYAEAIDDYTKYLEIKPKNNSAYNNRGLCKYNINDYIGAINDYSEAIKLEPKNTKYINNRANAYYCNDEYENAVNDWNKVLELKPDYEIDYFDKAYAEDKIGQYAEAIDDYTKHLEMEPESDGAYNNRGWCKYNINDYIGAINDYSEAIKLNSEYSLFFNNRANAYYKLKEYQNAVNDWNKVFEIDPDYEIDYFRKAYAEAEIGQYAEAIDDYTKYLEIEPESDDAYNNRGWCKYNINDYIGAINDYSEAIKLEPKNTKYINNRANAYYKLKEYQNAVNDWNKVLEIDPDYKIDYFDKAYAEDKIGQYAEAIDDYTKYLVTYSDNAGAFYNRGLCKGKLKDYKDAIKDYNKAIKLEPKNTKYINNRADAYYWNDEYEKAVKDWNKVLKIDSEYPIYYFEKAYAENEIGLYEDALLSIEKELKKYPDDEDALNLKSIISENLSQNDENLISEYLENAESYYEKEEYEKAVNEWNKVLEIDPDYEIDYFNKSNSEYIVGLFQDAIISIDKYLDENPNFEKALDLKKMIKKSISKSNSENLISECIRKIKRIFR